MAISFALAYEDHIRRADFEDGGPTGTSNPAPTVGAWSDLQTPQLGKGATWVSGTGVLVVITVRFASPQQLDLVSLLDFRASAPLSFSAIDYYEPSTFDQLTWFASPVPIDYPSDDFVQHLHFIGPSVIAEGIRMTLSTSATELYLGRLWAGPLWSPPDGIKRAWTQSIIDPGDMTVSRGGQGYPRRRQRRRALDVTLSHMPAEHAFGKLDGSIMDLQQIGYRVGTTETVIVMPRTRDRAGDLDLQAIHRLGVYGHLTDPLRIEHLAGQRFEAQMRVAELL